MLGSVLSTKNEAMTIIQFLMCSGTSIVLGLLVAAVHMYKNPFTKSFVMTLAMLPLLVQSVIMLVNGNVGTGMAVLGAFSLIRFRSVAGGAREITSIFWSMGIGLGTGMGLLAYMFLFSIVTAIVMLILDSTKFGSAEGTKERQLRIKIPEDIEYDAMFEKVFANFTSANELEQVRTTDMGSLYELTYRVTLKEINEQKAFLDALRQRNGNLTVTLGKVATIKDEL